MIKFILLFILSISLYAAEFTKIYVSKNHALITFMESLNGTSYVSKVPRELYLKKHTKDSLININKLHQKISRSKIYNHKKTKNLLEALYIESLKAKDLVQFEKNILYYTTSISKNKIKNYFKYIKTLKPFYKKRLWDRYYKTLLQKKAHLQRIMDRSNYNEMIKTLGKFYGVDLSKLDTFKIALYPIPKKSNIMAFSIKDVETIGIFPHKRQSLNWLLSATILHEISHTIYTKSDIVKKQLNFKSKKKRILINEVLATTIGAGWGYNKISNKYATHKWYNNKQYDKLAKKIYPKIKSYLDKNKKMDKELVKYLKGTI